MSELMADIIADVRTDGTLDEPSLGSQLIDNARLMDLPGVRQNLESKYSEPGMGSVEIPPFESYVQQFIAETTYEPQTFITYPETSGTRINILAPDVTTIQSKGSDRSYITYSLKAEMPEGTRLRVVLKGGEWYGSIIPPENWSADPYNSTTLSQVFTVTQSGVPNNLNLSFKPGDITVEYYENGAEEPTRIKELVVEPLVITPPDSTHIIP